MDAAHITLKQDNFTKSTVIKINFAFLFMIVLFFFNETFRSLLSEKAGWINVPFLVCGSVFMITCIYRRKIRHGIFLLVLFFSMLVMLNTLILHKSFTYDMMTISNLLLPLFLISVRIKEEQALMVLRTFLKFFNVFILILLAMGIIDYFSHSYIQLYLASNFNDFLFKDLIFTEHQYGIYRYYSIFGHPLQNAKFFLIFMIMNNIYAKYDKRMINGYLVSAITMIGLLLSGSKTAIIIGVFLIIFFSNIKKYKFVYYLFILGALIIFFNTSLFQDNLKMRFLDGIKYGDLTSGRNVLLQQLIDGNGEKPKFLLGGGSGYSRQVAMNLNGNINNFEYSPIMLAYDYGLLGALIIYICTFFYPLISFLRTKKIYIFFSFLTLVIMINSNNSLASLAADSMSQLCFIILILTNLGKEPVKDIENTKKRKKIKITW